MYPRDELLNISLQKVHVFCTTSCQRSSTSLTRISCNMTYGSYNMTYGSCIMTYASYRIISWLMHQVCIQFPDPWRVHGKHAARRTLSTALAQQLCDAMPEGSELYLASDCLLTSEDMRSTLSRTGGFILHPMHAQQFTSCSNKCGNDITLQVRSRICVPWVLQ
jgi:hypothetical protein